MARRIIRHSIAALGLAALACNFVLDVNALQEGCPANQKFCENECVALNLVDYGCSDRESCSACALPNATRHVCLDGECSASRCAEGFKPCDGQCVATTDPAFGCAGDSCGACPTSGGTAICTAAGACGYEDCAPGTKLCNNTCVDVDLPAYGCAAEGCGACSIANSAGIECVQGECTVSGCKAGFKLCEDRNECASLTSPTTGCGNLNTCNRCVLANTGTAGCANGVCVPLTCSPATYANCDERGDNGCEANTLTDVNNCGLCNTRCDASKANVATVKCVNGGCKVATCEQGFADCDGSLGANGCEVNIYTNSQRCGSCTNRCETGQICVNGVCQ